jgi:S1-C subfamily serine protease
MAEGLYTPAEIEDPFFRQPATLGAIVRILPTTELELHLVDDDATARALARNEIVDGIEIWYRVFTRSDIARCADGGFFCGMVSHEFCTAIAQGKSFPHRTPLIGGGTGFAITGSGHILTNYHLVAAEVDASGRGDGVLHSDVKVSSLRAQFAEIGVDGDLVWRDADAVYLVSNPPTSRAIHSEDGIRGVLREDVALLRIEPAPAHFLTLARGRIQAGAKVSMAGFPLRTKRSPEARRSLGYADADGSLRVTVGQVTEREQDYFTTDADGSMGNSGSPVFDLDHRVVGLFSRSAGDGPRNATEYGYMSRVNVDIELAITSLGLDRLLD